MQTVPNGKILGTKFGSAPPVGKGCVNTSWLQWAELWLDGECCELWGWSPGIDVLALALAADEPFQHSLPHVSSRTPVSAYRRGVGDWNHPY